MGEGVICSEMAREMARAGGGEVARGGREEGGGLMERATEGEGGLEGGGRGARGWLRGILCAYSMHSLPPTQRVHSLPPTQRAHSLPPTRDDLPVRL